MPRRATRRFPLLAAVAGLGLLAVPATPSVWGGETDAPRPRPAPRAAAAPEGYPSLEALERELARLIEETHPSVVSVVARSSLQSLLGNMDQRVGAEAQRHLEEITRRVGSGVVLDDQGHVVTVASVVAGASEVDVLPADGSRLRARIRGVDDDSGVAVLIVDKPSSLRAVRMGDAGSLRPGSLVTALGNPREGGPAYSVGFVSGIGVSHGPLRRGPYLRLDAYTAPGAAGGPVFDVRGQLVGLLFGAGEGPDPRRGRGVITWEEPDDPEPPPGFPGGDEPGSDAGARARLQVLRSLHRAGASGSAVSYAVPVDVLRQVSAQIIRSGSVRRGWLGVTIESLEPDEVRLMRVQQDSPAHKAGLRVEDRIVRIDGQEVHAADEVVAHLALLAPGTPVSFTVSRGGRRLDVPVVLGERPESLLPFKVMMHPRMAGGPPPQPRLGVLLDTTDDAMRQKQGAPQGVGLVVREVWPGSRGLAAGLEAGDILIEIGGEAVRSVNDVRQALRGKSDAETDLKVVREGNVLVLRLPPAPMPAPAAPPVAPRPRNPRSPKAPRAQQDPQG